MSITAFLLFLVPAVAAQEEQNSLPARISSTEKVPILAWIGPPDRETTVERYKELAEAGFTQNFSSFPDLVAMDKAMEVARAAGIRQFVCCPELSKDPEGVAGRYRGHPALAGYHLRDEPNAGDFANLAKWTRRIQSIDKDHWCYINLFPNYASAAQLGTKTYAEHVDRFLAEVPTQILSFDHYPVAGNSLRPEWYENLEIVAKASQAVRKPFWAFALSVAHDPYPVATLEHLRLQVFSNLAYGAQGIQHFTYWVVTGTQWNFREAPIDASGKRTAVYGRVRQVNGEAQGLAGVFLGSRVLGVGHTGALPRGTQPFKVAPPLKDLKANGGAVVSLLSKHALRFLVIVNRDFKSAQPVSISFDGSTKIGRVDKEGVVHPLAGDSFSEMLDPGDAVVFAWRMKP